MLRRPASLLLMTLGLGAVLAPAPAFLQPAAAQSLQTYLPRRLTGSDIDILRAEAAKLGPQGPSAENWKNPKTGHSGHVAFLQQSEKDGMQCRSFRYTFHLGTSNDGLPYKLTWCEKSPGDWAIAN